MAVCVLDRRFSSKAKIYNYASDRLYDRKINANPISEIGYYSRILKWFSASEILAIVRGILKDRKDGHEGG